MICGRCSRTESRTFSSCRSQSRAPREKRSYQLLKPTGPCSLPLSVIAYRPSELTLGLISLLGQQGRDVAQRFLRAVLVIAVILHQPLLYDGDLLLCFLVRSCRRRNEPQHVSPLLEQILLDRLAHPRVARELELLAGLERDHRLAHDLLTERQLAGIGNL